MHGCERLEPALELHRGDLIAGRYAYVRKLGSGGMGTLHLAIAQGPSGFAKQVVLKMPHRFGEPSESDRERVLREARLAARLEHPSIVHTFEVIETERFPVIVMEYLRGWALSAVRPYNTDPNAPALPLAGWLRVLSDTLGALRYVHQLRDFDGRSMGLVHRDVSPQNIFITDEGYVKLLDFGAATLQHEASGGAPHAGKLRYMPREQLLGEGVDGRVDLYAVGGLLWEALSGQRLWKDLEPEFMRARILLGRSPPRDEQAIPEEFRRVVDNALAPRDARYSTAEELDRALLEAAGGEHALWSHAALREWMLESFVPFPEESSAASSDSPPESCSDVPTSKPSSLSGERRVAPTPAMVASDEHTHTERLDPQSALVLATTKASRRDPAPARAAPSRWYLAALATLLVVGLAATLAWHLERVADVQLLDTAVGDSAPTTSFPLLVTPKVRGLATAQSRTGNPGAKPRVQTASGSRARSDSSSTRSRSKAGEHRVRAAAEPDAGPPASVSSGTHAQSRDCAYLDADGIKRYRPGCL